MIATTNDNFAQLPAWTPPSQLMQFAEPPQRVLAKFIHGCSPHPATRTAATTALVLSFWQLRGTKLTPEVPSLLLLHPGEAEGDPIDKLVKELVFNDEENQPRIQTQGPFMYAPIEEAPQSMRNAYRKRQSLGHDLKNSPSSQLQARNAEERFHAAAITGFGYGRCRPYAKAWHSDYGLLTDKDDQIILRLNDAGDRAAFLKDAESNRHKLAFPTGVGPHLSPVMKSISLSGSLSKELMGNARRSTLVSNILSLGRPVFVLPHVGHADFKVDNLPALEALAYTWRHAAIPPVFTLRSLPASAWVRAYQNALRKRLVLLPHDYEFAVQQALRQLDGICDRIVGFAGRDGAELDELGALVRDLYGHVLRGVVLGVAGLSWFGLGLHLGPECEPLRDKALRLLKRLRTTSPASMKDLLKNHHFSKRERDALLARFLEEGLVRVEGKEVVATSYREFVERLHASAEFPPVVNHWEQLQAQLKAAAK